MKHKKIENIEAVRLAFSLRIQQLGHTPATLAVALGVSKQATFRRIRETHDIAWLAEVAYCKPSVLLKADPSKVLAQPLPKAGWLESVKSYPASRVFGGAE